MMSVFRRILQIVLLVATLMVGVASLGIIVSQTGWFRDWLRGVVERQAQQYLNGELSIGRLHGNLVFGLGLDDVEIRMAGEPVIGVRQIELAYSALTLARGDVVIDELHLEGPVVRLERTAEGWNVERLLNLPTPDPDSPSRARPVVIESLTVDDGTVHVNGDVGIDGVNVPERIDRLQAALGVSSDPDELVVDVEHLSFQAHQPALRLEEFAGTIRRTEGTVSLDGLRLQTADSSLRADGEIHDVEGPVQRLDLRASSDGFALQEFAGILPALEPYPLTPVVTVTATGPLDQLAVDLSAVEPQVGEVRADLTLDALAPERRVSGVADVTNLDLAPITRTAAATSTITGRARFDLVLPGEEQPLRGTYAMTAPRVTVAGYTVRDLTAEGRIDGDTIAFDGTGSAYGARATATGTVVTDDPLRLDVRGRAVGVDLRQLPPDLDVPRVESRLDVTYRLSGRGGVFEGDVAMQRSTLAGATIEPGTTATFRVGDGAPRYTARGEVRELNLRRVGETFGIEALADERFEGDLHGAFDVTGQGGGQQPLVLDASASLVDSTLFGARLPQFDIDAQLAGGDMQVQATGTFEELDPAVLTGDERHAGDLSGTADVTATIRGYADGVALDDVVADGRVTLEPSTMAGLTIDSASLDGAYERGLGQVREFVVTGRDLNARAEGVVALTDAGTSNLMVHLDTPSLDEIGELVGQPLQGSLVVDAVVLGNARELTIEGMLQGSQFAYGDIEALTLTSDFHVTLPELTVEDATIQAVSRATFLEIAGQEITELMADVTFREPQLEFTVEAQEGLRQLTAGGLAIFHPERQEIQLTELGLQAENVSWRIAEGSEAVIDYGGDRIEVDNLQLVSVGDQRIEVSGVFGEPGEVLRVTAQNVDVAELDRLVLGDERIQGRLTAEATVSGTMEEPRVQAEFTLAPGAFQDFTFESLTGSADYSGPGVTLDVRLDQAPQHWLTIDGYAPLTLFRPTPLDAERPVPPPAAEQVDLTIASSDIDLGVIQGFTDAVTDVTGMLQANIRVTGTGFDPFLEGAVEIAGGGLTVPALGTTYSGIDTRLDLNDDVVSIQEMRILDEGGNALTVGGTLSVQERALGTFDVEAMGRNFQVLDNELGDIVVDATLRLAGTLRAPRVVGFIDVADGTLEVAELVQRFTTAPYRVDAAAVDPLAPPPVPPPDEAVVPVEPLEEGEAPGLFDAVDMELAVAVPANLLLRGTGIRPAGAPVAVGDINVTVGGAIQIRKAPGDALRLNGEVNTIRGHYTFQGRRFDILRDGRIRFAGQEVIDPLLDIRARRLISGVETVIHVQGTMRQPEMAFTSTPPLDQADILSLIVFNMPLNELGEGQQISLAERAGALAGGYLAAGLTRSIGRVIGLDEFEIQARGELGTAPRLIIGERIGNDLFVRIEQGFGAEQATEFSLEYQIAEFLRLTGSIAEAPGGAQRVQFRRVERGGIDLTFFFSF